MTIEIPESVMRNHGGDRGFTFCRKPVVLCEREELIAVVNFILEQQLRQERESARREELGAQRRALAPF
jgi:predicted metal-binding transcription factor (methanogenesis marker protein 9)